METVRRLVHTQSLFPKARANIVPPVLGPIEKAQAGKIATLKNMGDNSFTKTWKECLSQTRKNNDTQPHGTWRGKYDQFCKLFQWKQLPR